MTLTIQRESNAPLHLELLPQRVVHIPDLHALILSDVHLGKAAHFREHGVPVPDAVANADLAVLSMMVNKTNASLYIVGDLVHAGYNAEWEQFAEARATWPVDVHVVRGNHDVLVDKYARALGLQVHDSLMLDNIQLVHDPKDAEPNAVLSICGHVHPSVSIKSGRHVSDRIPCFHYTTQGHGPTLLLPAFGSFTGSKAITRVAADRVFGIVGDEVIEIP